MTRPFSVGLVPGVSADKWVRVWRERLPDAPLSVVALPHDGVPAAVSGEVDMAFVRLPLDPAAAARLQVIQLWEEKPMVVAARDHPVRAFDAVVLADLAGEEQRAGWDDAVLDLVAAGHGVARMPQSVFRAAGRRDLVAREITDAEPTRVGLVWDPASAGSSTEEFIGIVRGRTANSSRGAADPEPAAERRAAARPARAPRRPDPSTSRRRTNGGRKARGGR